jgi:hypothetical protein
VRLANDRIEMASERLSDPGVVDRIDVRPSDPDPSDRLLAGETPIETVALSPGWIVVTDRAVLSYHPDRDLAVRRTPRSNVTSITVRRTGGRAFLGYVPGAILYTLAALAGGVLLLAVSPTSLLVVPDAPGAGGIETVLKTLEWASRLLGTVLVFSGILIGLAAVVVVGYWLSSREVALVLERGAADPIECPTDRHTGQRALRALRDAFPD